MLPFIFADTRMIPVSFTRAGDKNGVPEELLDTGTQRLVGDLDELPHPVLGYRLIEAPGQHATLSARAMPVDQVHRRSPISSLVLTFGCKFACPYCPIPSYNQRQYRVKSALLQDRLEEAISQAQRAHKMVAVLLIDLDGFKRVNDSLGHAAGDHLLQAVAARLSAGVRGADTACRHGGDEFVIMLPDVEGLAMADAVVAKLRARLYEPHVIEGHEIRITASVGSALYRRRGQL